MFLCSQHFSYIFEIFENACKMIVQIKRHIQYILSYINIAEKITCIYSHDVAFFCHKGGETKIIFYVFFFIKNRYFNRKNMYSCLCACIILDILLRFLKIPKMGFFETNRHIHFVLNMYIKYQMYTLNSKE